MNVLVLNGGSSSIKFSLFSASTDHPSLLLDGELTGIGTPTLTLELTGQPSTPTKAAPLDAIFHALGNATIDAVGHRVVHPGPHLQDHVRITDDILATLEAAAAFAPLHDPEAITFIREAMRRTPGTPHFACFDTVFHQTMPPEASTYPIPAEYRNAGVRRYGFHGLSCESVVRQLRLAGPLPARMAVAHLGSGCSVTAVQNGVSVDTTMGLTPTGGIVMGTRPGDLDPGLLLYLLRQQQGDHPADVLENMLNHNAGMVALTGLPNDMKAVRRAAADGNADALLALQIFTRAVRKAIGGFAWLMGGLDAIIFTGGIGQHDSATRADVTALTDVHLNITENNEKSESLRRISASDSSTAVFVVPAQEDLVIALHVQHMVRADA